MPPNIGTMVSGNPGPAHSPPAVKGKASEGAAAHVVGKSEPGSSSAIDRFRSGDRPDSITSQPTTILGSTGTKTLAEAGPESFTQGMAAGKPKTTPDPTRPGNDLNKTDGLGPDAKGTHDGRPAAGAGPGTGRQPAAQGTTISKTAARPRGNTGGFIGAK